MHKRQNVSATLVKAEKLDVQLDTKSIPLQTYLDFTSIDQRVGIIECFFDRPSHSQETMVPKDHYHVYRTEVASKFFPLFLVAGNALVVMVGHAPKLRRELQRET